MTRKARLVVVMSVICLGGLLCACRLSWDHGTRANEGMGNASRLDDRNSSSHERPSGTGKEASSGDAVKLTVAEARQVMRDYARDWKAEKILGVSLPQLPSLPPDVARAVDLMRETADKEILTSVAIVLVKYGREVSTACGHGMPIGRAHRIVEAFITTSGADGLGDDIVTSSIVKWIAVHRERFAPSPELDAQVNAFQQEEATRLRRFDK